MRPGGGHVPRPDRRDRPRATPSTTSPATPTPAPCCRRSDRRPLPPRRERRLLTGDVPSPANPPKACRFHTRCPKAQELCSVDDPPLEDKGTGTLAACHYPLTREEVAAIGVRSRDERGARSPIGRARGPGAARGADPLQHGQPARQRAGGPGVPRGPSRGGRLRVRAARRRARAAEPRGPARAADGPRGRARRSATWATSTRSSRTRAEWTRDPWSGDIAEGFLWGRGALDMKSPGRGRDRRGGPLARSGWRPARGELLIVAVVDEETGGRSARSGSPRTTPRRCAATCSLNEGGGARLRVRRRALLRRLLRREGRLPLHASRPRAWPATPRCRGWARTRC